MNAARDLFTQLLDATPPPPVTADIDELLTAFDRIHARRQEVLDEAARNGPVEVGDDDRALAHEVMTRQDAWHAALAAARAQLCEARLGVGKMRAYAATDAAELER